MPSLQPIDQDVAWRDALREQIKNLRKELEPSLVQATQASNRGIEDPKYVPTQADCHRLLTEMKVYMLTSTPLSSRLTQCPLFPSHYCTAYMQTVIVVLKYLGSLP